MAEPSIPTTGEFRGEAGAGNDRRRGADTIRMEGVLRTHSFAADQGTVRFSGDRDSERGYTSVALVSAETANLADASKRGSTVRSCPDDQRGGANSERLHVMISFDLDGRAQNEPSVDFDRSSKARISSRRTSSAGLATASASLPATNCFGGLSIDAIVTRTSPSFAGSPCWAPS